MLRYETEIGSSRDEAGDAGDGKVRSSVSLKLRLLRSVQGSCDGSRSDLGSMTKQPAAQQEITPRATSVHPFVLSTRRLSNTSAPLLGDRSAPAPYLQEHLLLLSINTGTESVSTDDTNRKPAKV